MTISSCLSTPEKWIGEVELAVTTGNRGGYIGREDTLEYVAGDALHNDYSERVFQLERGGQWQDEAVVFILL